MATGHNDGISATAGNELNVGNEVFRFGNVQELGAEAFDEFLLSRPDIHTQHFGAAGGSILDYSLLLLGNLDTERKKDARMCDKEEGLPAK